MALVIGNGGYADAPLRNPANDARAMKEALESCNFEVTLLTDSSKRVMEDAIRDFGDKIRNGAVGLFYFAGHGIQVKGTNYLVPVGANLQREDEVPYQAVDAGLVLDKMDAAKNKLNIVILDACRNNPFAHSWRTTGDKGLAQVKAPMGTLVAYATAPGSIAADGSGDHGLYTGALIQELQEPGLPMLEVFQKVREKVVELSQRSQTPWESNSTIGTFFFRAQRTAEEIAREQAVVQEETRRLEGELQAQLAKAQTAEAARQADLLKSQLRVQELERQRLEEEESRRQMIEAETRQVKAEDARRKEEATRLEALKQRLAQEQIAVNGGLSIATLEDARQEMIRLTLLRDKIIKPIQDDKAQALADLENDYAFLQKRLEAPKDEFETTTRYQARMKEAVGLQLKMKKERAGLESKYAELANNQTKAVDQSLSALKAKKLTSTFQVELGTYDADQGRYTVRVPIPNHRYVQATLAIEPEKAKELQSRKELLKAEGDSTLSGDQATLPSRLMDPVWGALPLKGAKVKFEAGATERVEAGYGIQLDFVMIPAGRFMMGEGQNLHQVTISRDFWMGKSNVTLEQWRAALGDDPSVASDCIPWEGAQAFIARLNKRTPGKGYRLPTEAEWEYAWRIGNNDNAWGLDDMNGDVFQWCQDWYGSYPSGSLTDPKGPFQGSLRVFRGGSKDTSGRFVRSADQNWYDTNHRHFGLGFRIVMETFP
ncbi:MAG: caspase family protein [Holophaga sp.]